MLVFLSKGGIVQIVKLPAASRGEFHYYVYVARVAWIVFTKDKRRVRDSWSVFVKGEGTKEQG